MAPGIEPFLLAPHEAMPHPTNSEHTKLTPNYLVEGNLARTVVIYVPEDFLRMTIQTIWLVRNVRLPAEAALIQACRASTFSSQTKVTGIHRKLGKIEGTFTK
jgi:hypothetical protein